MWRGGVGFDTINELINDVSKVICKYNEVQILWNDDSYLNCLGGCSATQQWNLWEDEIYQMGMNNKKKKNEIRPHIYN